jgi:hypothetical protein
MSRRLGMTLANSLYLVNHMAHTLPNIYLDTIHDFDAWFVMILLGTANNTLNPTWIWSVMLDNRIWKLDESYH